jgi:tRNA-dihydrouridine synthase B
MDFSRDSDHFLQTGQHLLPARHVEEVRQLMSAPFASEHYAFYGDYLGVRTARKHIGWYVK